jgi:hypothetical protein
MKPFVMATYTIDIRLMDAKNELYTMLEAAMLKANFVPVKSAAAPGGRFSYFGNQDMLHVNEAVKRALMTTAGKYSFTVIKDKRAERQYHAHAKDGVNSIGRE